MNLGYQFHITGFLALSTVMGNSVCTQYETDQVVCPPSLKKNVFTTSAYHAKEIKDLSVLLPLFQEESKSPAMIRHGMDVIKGAVHFLNNNQTPVMACDQPLYLHLFCNKFAFILYLHVFIFAKQIQCNWKN